MTHIFQNHADMRIDETVKLNAEESNETPSSAKSTPSSKLLAHHEEATFETIETQTASTEIQNDSSLNMDLSLEEREESVEERNKLTQVIKKYENKFEEEPGREINLKV
jgi:hypothetical protein